jgi:uncharacterized membrane protein HdeD (DUF308 family)
MEIADGLLPWLLGVLAVLFATHGLPRVARAIRERDSDGAPLLLLRGARTLLIGIALAVIAAGQSTGSEALTWFGVAFLAEETYETSLVLLILRWGKARGLL